MDHTGRRIIAPELLLEGYSQGIFPMAESRESRDVEWYSARLRGVIPMDQFHVSKNVKKLIRNGPYRCEVNRDFEGVMRSCASRNDTWINDLIVDSFTHLHELGFAHSVEIYNDDQMVGGLYGVALRGAFFGESMFQFEKETAKIALYHCHKLLQEGGFVLWDTQFHTKHLSQFGCIEIPGTEYAELLKDAMRVEAVFGYGRRVR